MKVLIDIDDNLVAAALSFCAPLGLNDLISEAVRSHIAEEEDRHEIQVSSLEIAISAAAKIRTNAEFQLIELFSSADWQAIAPGQRKSLGRAFRKAVEQERIADYVRMTDTRKAVYRRL